MDTAVLPGEASAVAPDGSEVRLLVVSDHGGMAHFQLRPNEASVAVAHRTLDEMWYFVAGRGVMWRKHGDAEDGGEQVDVYPGVALTIPADTHFQFKSVGAEPLAAVAVTMPPWPGIGDMSGKGEVYFVNGPWEATVTSGIGD